MNPPSEFAVLSLLPNGARAGWTGTDSIVEAPPDHLRWIVRNSGGALRRSTGDSTCSCPVFTAVLTAQFGKVVNPRLWVHAVCRLRRLSYVESDDSLIPKLDVAGFAYARLSESVYAAGSIPVDKSPCHQ